jgi:hypothetical protein
MDEVVNNVDVKVEVRTRARKGFEDLYDLIVAKLANLEEEIAKEFEVRKTELTKFLNGVSETYEVEVPVTDCNSGTLTTEEV